MASLAARYAAGEHEAVWRELDFGFLPIKEQFEIGYDNRPSSEEVEDVMRQTFEQVARNVDRLIERLRDLGYLFECEAGRYSAAYPPRAQALNYALQARDATLERFDELDANLSGPFPGALVIFAEVVGNIDLRQRFPREPEMPETKEQWAEYLKNNFPHGLPEFPEDTRKALEKWLPIMEELPSSVPLGADAEEARQRRQIAEAGDIPWDAVPHDPVLSRLGDWDPLEVNFDYLRYTIGEEEAELLPLPNGGLALHAEFAGSFETKAYISGAWNPTIYLPSYRVDPMVYAEGIALPFTTYLRKAFRQGGFFGTPRPFFRSDGPLGYLPTDQWPAMREVEPGIFLPEHSIFAELAKDLEPF